MNNPIHWSAHLKHLLIAAGALLVCWFGVTRYADMRVELAKITAGSAEKIKANEATQKQAQTTIDTAQHNISAIDADRDRRLDGLEKQLNSKPDSAEIRATVEQALQGVKTVEAKDAQGNAVLGVADTQENREAINKADVAFKSCRFNLDDCTQKQTQYQTIIAGKDVQIGALKDTVKTKDDTIKELTRFGKGGNFWARTGRVIIPAGCGAAAAGLAAQGGIKPKGVALAAVISAGACALTIRF